MQRRYVLAGFALIAALALAVPAGGAESALSLAKRALSTAKKAEKTGYLNRATAEPDRLAASAATADNTASSFSTRVSLAAPGGVAFESSLAGFVKAGTPAAGNGLYGAGNICLINGNVIG